MNTKVFVHLCKLLNFNNYIMASFTPIQNDRHLPAHLLGKKIKVFQLQKKNPSILYALFR